MNIAHQHLIKRAYAIPRLRQIIVNKGTIHLYCDFSGHDNLKYCGLACCLVYNKTIDVTAKKISFEQVGDSIYGELLAIIYSLDILRVSLNEHLPKFVVLFTDCSSIARLLLKNPISKPVYHVIINQITESLDDLKIRFPEVEVSVKYISKHKKNNPLHRLAHNAARKIIGK